MNDKKLTTEHLDNQVRTTNQQNCSYSAHNPWIVTLSSDSQNRKKQVQWETDHASKTTPYTQIHHK